MPTGVQLEAQISVGRNGWDDRGIRADQHPSSASFELGDAANNDTKLIVLLGFPRSALQTSDALKQQVTLIDVV